MKINTGKNTLEIYRRNVKYCRYYLKLRTDDESWWGMQMTSLIGPDAPSTRSGLSREIIEQAVQAFVTKLEEQGEEFDEVTDIKVEERNTVRRKK